MVRASGSVCLRSRSTMVLPSGRCDTRNAACGESQGDLFRHRAAVSGRETILRETAAAGNEIGNHSLRHFPLHQIGSDADVKHETSRYEYRNLRCHCKDTFRFPSAGIRSKQARAKSRTQVRLQVIVQASVAIADYEYERADVISEAILGHAHLGPGAIIDLHDGRPPYEIPVRTGGSRRGSMADSRCRSGYVPTLLERGYRFVTVSELLASCAGCSHLAPRNPDATARARAADARLGERRKARAMRRTAAR